MRVDSGYILPGNEGRVRILPGNEGRVRILPGNEGRVRILPGNEGRVRILPGNEGRLRILLEPLSDQRTPLLTSCNNFQLLGLSSVVLIQRTTMFHEGQNGRS